MRMLVPPSASGPQVERVWVLVDDVELEAVDEHMSDDVTRRRLES
jgi:hypothetical protein